MMRSSTENGSGFAPGKNRPGLLCCLSQFPRDKSHLPKQATGSDTEIHVLDSVAWLHPDVEYSTETVSISKTWFLMKSSHPLRVGSLLALRLQIPIGGLASPFANYA
jgi:hypothetical protein